MTEIYIIRHVQAEGNLYRMCQGHWDGDVTALGARQRDALAERFRGVKIDEVWSSDLYRARFTAGAVTRYRPMEIHTNRDFREIDLGPWETRFFGDLAWEESPAFHDFIFDQKNFRLEGAETYGQVIARASRALEELADSRPGKSLALATHGVTIRCMLSALGGIDLDDTKTLPIFNNTGVARLIYQGGRFQVDYLNDYSHLPQELCVRGFHGPDLRQESIDPAQWRDYYLDCYAQSWQAAHGSLRGFDGQAYLESAQAHHRLDGEAVLCLLDKEEPVGLLDLDTQRGAHAGYGWVSLLYLKPEYRHRGCGVQILARAIRHYGLLGRRAIRLHVAESNREAIDFYRRWGFKALTREPGAEGGHVILMEKALGGREHE